MTQFSDREKAFETKYQKDQELQFKVTARRNKLLGLGAAEKLGMDGGDADEYAKSVVLSDLEEPGDEDVFRKVRADLDKASHAVSDDEIRQQMLALMTTAKQQIRDGA